MATRPARSTEPARSTARRRHRTAHLEFSAIEIVGSLLTPDIVARVAAFDAPDQTEESYGILPGLNLRDEIARYYRIGEALWSRFSQSALANPDSSTKFVTTLLQQCFGFDTLHPEKPVYVGERVFPLHHAALGIRVPVVIAPSVPDGHRRAGVDEGLTRFADGTRRRSATLLVQEYLNAAPETMWGIASDGFALRLLRDSVSLTRPAWIEANIAKIFAEGLFPDFSALWLLIHQSRFGQADATASDCSLERWRECGRTDGVAAREHLRNGVKAALLELGSGFIEHPANHNLRQALSSGSVSGQSYYEELLRLVYRFIFLFVAEDRGLLHTSKAADEARRVYADGYSLGRLRERCMRRAAWDRHTDAWEGVKAAHSALARGDERLGLPALGGLFAPGVLANLENARLENRRLLAAIWRLAWLRPEGQPLTRVNWRDMETEEFGSVYESLLELVPRPSADRRTFQFADAEEDRGSERKKSGSYYTSDSLVKLLLDSTLDPMLDAAEARNSADPAAEILKLSIIDPACGSGHFLLGAARRAAGRIAKLRSPGAPSQAEFQHALREVVSQCIYGVDRNHMAVELCRVALWIEALESDKPLAFLDNHVRCGDSLIGVFSYDTLRKGIPDEAYKQLTGDSKDAAKSYARLNKEGREGKAATGMFAEFQAPQQLAAGAMTVFAMPEDSLEQVRTKAAAFDDLQAGVEWHQLKSACDSYVAAFFVPKLRVPSDENLADGPVPLTEHVWMVVRGASLNPLMEQSVERAVRLIGAFHWPMQFPHVFAKGGFDVVIGNPPWEVSQLGEQEYFASRSPHIAALAGDARKRAISNLEIDNPRLWLEFTQDSRKYDASNDFFRSCGRFDRTAVGKVNTYSLFAEHFSGLANRNGRSGIIVPTGIATDSSTSAFFGDLISKKMLAGLIDFENRDGIFPGVHRSFKFCLLTMGAAECANFSFFLTNAKQLEDAERKFSLTAEHISRINPNTKTAPVFRSRADAELTTNLYSKAPVLIEKRTEEDCGGVNPWGISFQAGSFNMTSASELFHSQQQLEADGWSREGTDWILDASGGIARRVPLYEAKMIHHFDHRWATYGGGAVDDEESARDTTLAEKQNPHFEPTPRYWVPEEEVKIRASRVPASVKRAFRDGKPDRCLKALAEWVAGFFQLVEGRDAREADLLHVLGRDRSWRTVLGASIDRFLLTPRTQATGREIQFSTPLCWDDLAFMEDGPDEPMALVEALIARKQPRWLMGWRKICRATDERQVITGLFPRAGSGDSLLLYGSSALNARMSASLLACLSSLTLDFVARQKVGGTNLNFFYMEQFPVIPPSAFNREDLEWITPRMLELTFTSESLKLWAEDLGHLGSPFSWDESRRASLRAELDAFFARKYGLSRDELRYVLDPADVKGASYPSETFRVLKNKEESRYGEYRTRRLVLEAWDRLGNI